MSGSAKSRRVETQSDAPLVVFDVLDSTNDSILEAGRAGAPEGTTHLARRQTRGRGRLSRAWWSPEGAGLWMSVLLRPRIDRARWPGISLVAGAAVERALLEAGVRGVELYWPNDLQVGRRKIGGILGEARAEGARAWIALGIGINIDLTRPEAAASLPAELRGIVTSMAEHGELATRDPVALARAIHQELWPLYRRFDAGEEVGSIVGERIAHLGRTVEVRLPATSPWRATVEGLGPGGELLLAPLGGGPRVSLTSGEVLYEEEA